MPKLLDNTAMPHNAIGEAALLHFIDQMNEIRARSGNRFRHRPVMKPSGVLGMEEHYAFPRPARPDTPSPRYGGHLRIASE